MPTSNKVEITFTSDDRDLLRSYQKQQEQLEKQIKKYERLNDKSKKATKSSKEGFDAATIAMKGSTLATGALLAGLTKVISLNADMATSAREAADEYERLGRTFQVQAGLKDLQLKPAQKRIDSVASAMAVSPDVAYSTATQLVSSGFSVHEATGPSLQSSLSTMKANNASGNPTDSAELVKSMAKFLSANSLDKTAANLDRVGRSVFSLFQSTDLQLADLSALSKKGGVLANGLTVEDQLAAQSTLVSASLPSDNASEALGQIVLRLGATKGDKTVETNLAKLGLKPDDVDLVGESFSTVLDRFSGGLSGLQEKDRASVLRGIFGDSAISPFGILVEQRAQFNRNLAQQANTDGYARAVDVATSGRGSAKIRQEQEQKQANRRFANDGDLYGDQFTIESTKYSTTGFGGAVQRSLGDAQRFLYGTATNFGFSPETAVRLAISPIDFGYLNNNEKLLYQNVVGNARKAAAPASQQSDAAYAAQMETNRLLKTLVDKTEKVETNTRNTEANTKSKPSRQIKRNEDR